MKLTRAQREALYKVWRRESPVVKGCNATGLTYMQFRRTVVPYIGGDCILVPWCGMWLGIEADGYTHS